MGAIIRQLVAVAPGFKRIQESDSNFSYPNGGTIATASYYNGGTGRMWINSTGLIRFNFVGSKLLINANIFTNKANNIKISLDGSVDTYSENASVVYTNAVVYERLDLEYKEHYVEIYCNPLTYSNWNFDSIDIDATGYLKPYGIVYSPKYLIKQNGVYYSTTYSQYDTSAKTYKPLLLSGGSVPNTTDINSYAVTGIRAITDSTTINGETFRPIDKLSAGFNVMVYKHK